MLNLHYSSGRNCYRTKFSNKCSNNKHRFHLYPSWRLIVVLQNVKFLFQPCFFNPALTLAWSITLILSLELYEFMRIRYPPLARIHVYMSFAEIFYSFRLIFSLAYNHRGYVHKCAFFTNPTQASKRAVWLFLGNRDATDSPKSDLECDLLITAKTLKKYHCANRLNIERLRILVFRNKCSTVCILSATD